MLHTHAMSSYVVLCHTPIPVQTEAAICSSDTSARWLAALMTTMYLQDRVSEFSTVKVVLGNESCDLDSAVCALVYALVLRESLGPSVGTTMVLPVLNIPQSDLPLKTEVMFYFAENDVPLDLIIFRYVAYNFVLFILLHTVLNATYRTVSYLHMCYIAVVTYYFNMKRSYF